jgi:hypothetical protein
MLSFPAKRLLALFLKLYNFDQTSGSRNLDDGTDDGEEERLNPDKGSGRSPCLFLAVSQTQLLEGLASKCVRPAGASVG